MQKGGPGLPLVVGTVLLCKVEELSASHSLLSALRWRLSREMASVTLHSTSWT